MVDELMVLIRAYFTAFTEALKPQNLLEALPDTELTRKLKKVVLSNSSSSSEEEAESVESESEE